MKEDSNTNELVKISHSGLHYHITMTCDVPSLLTETEKGPRLNASCLDEATTSS